jgi:hypothetical protein
VYSTVNVQYNLVINYKILAKKYMCEFSLALRLRVILFTSMKSYWFQRSHAFACTKCFIIVCFNINLAKIWNEIFITEYLFHDSVTASRPMLMFHMNTVLLQTWNF